jgi:hypothetical protein
MYTVIVLAEQALSAGDAQEVVSLHEAIEEPRRYFVLIPCEDAAARVEATLGTLGASDVLSPAAVYGVAPELDVDKLQQDIDEHAGREVEVSVAALRALGHTADGKFSYSDPVDALESAVSSMEANEVVVMTRPHVVAEFLHLDWSSRARRRLGVPVLHLIEHEPLDAEAGAPEGITGA